MSTNKRLIAEVRALFLNTFVCYPTPSSFGRTPSYSKQLKITYKNDMRNNNYNSSLNYRYFYAQHRLKMLTISHGRHEAFNLIKKEMGVTSIRAVRGVVNG